MHFTLDRLLTGRDVNSTAIRTLCVYALTFALLIFLNIDGVLLWYGNGEERVAREILTSLERVNRETGTGTLLHRFECAAGIFFEDSYRDKSKCRGNDGLEPARFEGRVGNVDEANSAFRLETDHFENALFREPAQPSVQDNFSKDENTAASTGLSLSALEDLAGSFLLNCDTEALVLPWAPLGKTTRDGCSAGPVVNGFTWGSSKAGFSSVLLVGDSLAQNISLPLNRELGVHGEVRFTHFAKVASGLANPNVLNWEETIRALMKERTPDLVIVMLGINDANNHLWEDGKLCMVGTGEWADAYENKVRNFLRIVTANNARVYWIGVPIVRDEQLRNRILMANTAARNACGKQPNCFFIDTFGVLVDESGHYTNYLRESNGSSLRIRTKDGIHLAGAGSSLLAKHIAPHLLLAAKSPLRQADRGERTGRICAWR